jgi:hypothetical protein
MKARYTVRTFNPSPAAGLGAPYCHERIYGTINLNSCLVGSSWNLNPCVIKELNKYNSPNFILISPCIFEH